MGTGHSRNKNSCLLPSHVVALSLSRRSNIVLSCRVPSSAIKAFVSKSNERIYQCGKGGGGDKWISKNVFFSSCTLYRGTELCMYCIQIQRNIFRTVPPPATQRTTTKDPHPLHFEIFRNLILHRIEKRKDLCIRKSNLQFIF